MSGRRSFVIYSQQFNEKHLRVGHVFRGRYQASLCDIVGSEKLALLKIRSDIKSDIARPELPI